MPNDNDVAGLVRRAVAEPLLIMPTDIGGFPDALLKWVQVLVERYPLWAFRPHAFAALNQGDLPTTYPMSTLVSSITRDEHLSAQSYSHFPASLDTVIDKRRCDLVLDEHPSWTDSYAEEEVTGEISLHHSSFGSTLFPRVLNGPVLAHYEPDTEHTIGGYISPYEEIGVELVALVEAREASAGSAERAQAQKRLDDYIASIAMRAPGRPTVISDASAKKLVLQGQQIMNALWAALHADVRLAPETVGILKALVTDGNGIEEWAIRLALPIFSAPEIRALRKAVQSSTPPSTGSLSHVELFTLQVLAHRLNLPVGTLARKVMNGWRADEADIGGPCAICGQRHTPQRLIDER